MVNILNFSFEGPWILGETFNDVPGIYVIFTPNKWVDVGETDKLGQRINGDNHERKPDWVRNSQFEQLNIAFLGMSNREHRLEIEHFLRQQLRPICGEK